MRSKIYLFVSFFALALVSCEYEFPTPAEEAPQEAQNADLSQMTFVGGSRFTGTIDGAYSANTAQFNLPYLMLRQGNFVEQDALVGPNANITSSFNIYLNADVNGSTGSYEAFYPSLDTTIFKRRTVSGESLTFSNGGSTDLRSYSFPGLSLGDITGTSPNNSYLNAFYPSLTGSLMNQLDQSTSTFMIIDAGYEDMINFALNGAAGNAEVATTNALTVGDLPSEALFRSQLEDLANTLIDGNRKGVLLNIPSILQFPVFSRIEFDLTPYIDGTPVLGTARSQASTLNNKLLAYYSQNPNIPSEDRRPLFDFAGDNKGNWGIINEDPTLADVNHNGEELPKIRHAMSNEYFIYENENSLKTGYGSNFDNPVPNNKFITAAEAELINLKIAAFNQIISDVAAASNGNLVVVDTKAFFDTLYEGYDRVLNNSPQGTTIDGVFYEPLISEFGIFSADGLNLNPAGNAMLANVIINGINNGYNGNLKGVNPNALPGTNFKLGQ